MEGMFSELHFETDRRRILSSPTHVSEETLGTGRDSMDASVYQAPPKCHMVGLGHGVFLPGALEYSGVLGQYGQEHKRQ
jgi:hypothetical protein